MVGVDNSHNRFMNSFELRQSLQLQNQKIENLTQQLSAMAQQNETLKDWNARWQTHRWDEELANQCINTFLRLELKGQSKLGLNDADVIILGYLSSIEGMKADRHVRGIARVTGLSVHRVFTALKRLQRKKLVKAWLQENKKKFYTLPSVRKLIEEAQIRQNPSKSQEKMMTNSERSNSAPFSA